MAPLVQRKVLLVACSWACATVLGALSPAHGAQLRLSILDSDTAKPVPCRIHLKDAAGKPVRPQGLPFWHDHFVCTGVAELALARGTYTWELDRGPEYLVTTGQLMVAENSPPAWTNRLRRLVNLSKEGWWSGELHVHRPLAGIELLMRAEDLHVAPVITWWNAVNQWRNRPLPAEPLVQFDGDRFYHQMGGEDERAGGALLLEIGAASRRVSRASARFFLDWVRERLPQIRLADPRQAGRGAPIPAGRRAFLVE